MTSHPFSPLRNRLDARVGLLLLFPLFFAAVCKADSGSFEATGDLNAARYSHSATLLLDGKVLVVGGLDLPADMTTTAELYDPATKSWTYTGGDFGLRYQHSATLLPNGMVLVAGGWIGLISNTNTAELYDSTTETWTATGSLHEVVLRTRQHYCRMGRYWLREVITRIR